MKDTWTWPVKTTATLGYLWNPRRHRCQDQEKRDVQPCGYQRSDRVLMIWVGALTDRNLHRFPEGAWPENQPLVPSDFGNIFQESIFNIQPFYPPRLMVGFTQKTFWIQLNSSVKQITYNLFLKIYHFNLNNDWKNPYTRIETFGSVENTKF